MQTAETCKNKLRQLLLITFIHAYPAGYDGHINPNPYANSTYWEFSLLTTIFDLRFTASDL